MPVVLFIREQDCMSDDVWTVKRILEWIEGFLAKHGDENPRVSAQWLVSEALGVSRMQLFIDAERPLTQDERAKLRDWTRRRAAGEPLQYITGEVAFRHITVKVREGVLIPRPETEVLVSEALTLLPSAPKPQDELDAELIRRYVELGGTVHPENEGGAVAEEIAGVLKGGSIGNRPGQDRGGETESDAADEKDGFLLVADICTGSGCIACSLASEHPKVKVIATDLSSEAVALARTNVEGLGLEERVEVIECDLAEGVDDALLGSFDLVISNPPYIPTEVLSELPSEVTAHEPSLALDGGTDGLDVFRRLTDWSARALAPGGILACELHETCLDLAAQAAMKAGFTDVRITNDLANRPRVLTARAPSA